ncbi:deacetylase [Thiohalocapsa marina]|uniref:Deacetylase n=2 Tax=Thiohalocapsa marina TaxID=424902 RepID=A0A5M8FTE8_9GAMM|nr:deacetylase [Thiohalocapsa marina]
MLQHGYGFDPTYGYSLDDLLAVEPPVGPSDFAPFWVARYRRALGIDPAPRLSPSAVAIPGFAVAEIAYRSTEGFTIRGWLLQPIRGQALRAFILGHGYGGISEPPRDLIDEQAIYLVPCFRGLGLSARPPISREPRWHVLHDIDKRDRYILGGCVEDVWTGVSALLALFPALAGRLGYLGISFGGGIGALALPWDERIVRGHLNVPTFGHQALRLRLPTSGSAAAVQDFVRQHRHVLATLAYYDAAVAAAFIRQPMHVAAARFDPVVAPPGQFAIYNALLSDKRLFVLDAGHFEYPNRARQERELMAGLRTFFSTL